MKKFGFILLTLVFGGALTAMAQTMYDQYYPTNLGSNSLNATHTKAFYAREVGFQSGEGVFGDIINVGGKRVYYGLLEIDFCLDVAAGATVTPDVEMYRPTGASNIHYYVYLDKGQDGNFEVNTDNPLDETDDLVSFSYYNGENSAGGTGFAASQSGVLPSFVAPTTPGLYRMRFKLDNNDITPNSSNNFVSIGGQFIDVCLNVRGTETAVSAVGENCTIQTGNGEAIPASVATGSDLSLKVIPNPGYAIHQMKVRYGYNLDGVQAPYLGDMLNWTEIEPPFVAGDGEYVVQADGTGVITLFGDYLRYGNIEIIADCQLSENWVADAVVKYYVRTATGDVELPTWTYTVSGNVGDEIRADHFGDVFPTAFAAFEKETLKLEKGKYEYNFYLVETGLPFKTSASYENAQWQVMTMNTNLVTANTPAYWQYNAADNSVTTTQDVSRFGDEHLWAFVGDIYHGYKIYNKAAGSAKMLYKEQYDEQSGVGLVPVMSAAAESNSNMFSAVAGLDPVNSVAFALNADKKQNVVYCLSRDAAGGISSSSSSSLAAASCKSYRALAVKLNASGLQDNDGNEVGNLSTFSAPFDAIVPAGMKVYSAKKTSDNFVTMEFVEEGKSILRNQGVVIASTSLTNALMVEEARSGNIASFDNVFENTANGAVTVDLGVKAFILGKADGEVGFFLLNPDDASKRTIAANKAYLVLPEGGKAVRMVFGDMTTGIESVENGQEAGENAPVYDLSGRQVKNLVKGSIYVKNGKKFIAK